VKVAVLQFRAKWSTIAATALFACAIAPQALAQETVSVDRWLVSNPFPADVEGDPLETDYLGAPGEVAVLPDRGRTVGGADWTLVRRDSSVILDLDGHRGDGEGPVVVYAHAYIRSVGDRTITLTWGGLDCTVVGAWLNGRSLKALGRPGSDSAVAAATGTRQARVRIGHGYNTLLLKAVSGDCPLGVAASIGPSSTESLDGLRVQASRPYGNMRTGPAPSLIADPGAGPEPVLGWKDGKLFGVAGVRVTAFAVTPLEGTKFKAKTGGEEVKREIEWLTPAEPETVLMPLSFKSLRRALDRSEGVDVELDWRNGEWKGTLDLDPEALLQAFHSPIRLLGWTVTAGQVEQTESADRAAVYDSEDEPHPLANLIPLPSTAGATLVGEWEVPGWLSGFTLRLGVTGAPGEYRLDSIPMEGDEIVLCTDCRKGDRVQIVVVTTDGWEEFPAVSVVDIAPPAVDGPGQAVEWLRMIDEKGSRKYRENAPATGQ
jgi:hypothetical protein